MKTMNPIEKEETDFRNTVTSRALALIRWPLIMCIVAVHVFPPVPVMVNGVVYDPSSYWLTGMLWKLVEGFLTENEVTPFFFISGYLFMVGADMTKARYRAKLQRRVQSLLIPYIIWNILAVLHMALFDQETFATYSWRGLLVGFVMRGRTGYPHDAPLWFLRDLMLCMLMLPVVLPMIRKWNIRPILLMWLACVGLYMFPSSYPLLLCSAMCFFYWGVYMATNTDNLEAYFKQWRCVPCLYVCLSILFVVIEPYSHAVAMIVKCLNMVVVIPLAVNAACWFVRKGYKANRFLTTATFFVFAAHYIVLKHFRTLAMWLFRPDGEWTMLAAMWACYFLLLGILLGCYFLFMQTVPAFARLLIGKRSA